MDTATVPTKAGKPASELETAIRTLDSPQHHRPKQETIYLTKLTYENREFLFVHEIPVTVTWNGAIWIYESEKYGIEGFETDKDEAYFAFRQDFDAAWENFACEEDSKLSEGAQRQKALLKSLVASVRYIE